MSMPSARSLENIMNKKILEELRFLTNAKKKFVRKTYPKLMKRYDPHTKSKKYSEEMKSDSEWTEINENCADFIRDTEKLVERINLIKTTSTK